MSTRIKIILLLLVGVFNPFLLGEEDPAVQKEPPTVAQWFLASTFASTQTLVLTPSAGFSALSQNLQAEKIRLAWKQWHRSSQESSSEGLVLVRNEQASNLWHVTKDSQNLIESWGPETTVDKRKSYFISFGLSSSIREGNMNLLVNGGIGTYLYSNIWDIAFSGSVPIEDSTLESGESVSFCRRNLLSMST